MIKTIYITIALFVCSNFVLSAQNSKTYTVKPGETLYRIAVMHKVSVNELKKINQHIIGNSIKANDVINIPTSSSATSNKPKSTASVAVQFDQQQPVVDDQKELGNSSNTPDPLVRTETVVAPEVTEAPSVAVTTLPKETVVAVKPAEKPEKDLLAITHVVQKGETLFSIAKANNHKIDELLRWNKLKDASLSVNQVLIVGWKNDTGGVLDTDELARHNIKKVTTPSIEKAATPLDKKFEKDKVSKVKKVRSETGNAIWFDDSAEVSGSANMYALHKTAPLYAIVEVINPINHKSVKVKVIGRLPNTRTNENVMISLAKSAARKLNVLDEKTLVECKYYISD